ncbi:putative component of the lipoprotein assembly complex [Enhygromyxa salina]|uniref:Putative component of the lipoprotein assembly complex n=1 Tax=Enhygromyxa salina TaxID=215803 RepID=A0A0C2D4D8_9BACT|nr:outer membrane protein assembly factor BamD [Enhygromyxa salina]KIG18066.1 putative component of the lipoprotein assembly complex [Enhygromyxa salina]
MIASVGAGLGCASGPNLSDEYGQTARENYELAVAEFGDKDWEEAIAYADFVRIRFPFSRYAVEAELLIARAEFELKNYVTSQDAFRQFLRLHPTHKHVRNGWVAYMAAVGAYMAAPSSVPFLPPHFQRDQSLLRETVIELDYFFDHHAGSQMEPLARKLEAEVQRRLLEHELYVARFHLDSDRPEAAIMRLESAHDRFPGIGLDAEVLFLLGITYLRIEEIELAREIFSELQMQHPDHHHGQQARLYLKYMTDRYGAPDPNRPRPDRSPPVPQTPPQAKPDEFKDWRWRSEQRRLKREGEAPAPAAPKTDGTATPEPAAKPPKAKAGKSESPESKSPESKSPESPESESESPESSPAAEPEAEAKPPAAEPEAEADPEAEQPPTQPGQ